MLITRKQIIQSKKIIGSEITKLQRVFFDEELLQDYKADGKEKLYWNMFDCVNDATADSETDHKIIGLDHININTYTIELSNKLKELFRSVNATEFYVLSHLKLDLFGNRENDYEPLVEAYKKLEELTGQTSYNEAFHLHINDIDQLIDCLFWIIRCDPSVPEYIFLFDKNEKLELFICKYGNVHVTEIGDQQLSNERLTTLGWQVIEGPEYDRFSDDGAIEGRRINLQ